MTKKLITILILMGISTQSHSKWDPVERRFDVFADATNLSWPKEPKVRIDGKDITPNSLTKWNVPNSTIRNTAGEVIGFKDFQISLEIKQYSKMSLRTNTDRMIFWNSANGLCNETTWKKCRPFKMEISFPDSQSDLTVPLTTKGVYLYKDDTPSGWNKYTIYYKFNHSLDKSPLPLGNYGNAYKDGRSPITLILSESV